MQYRKMVAWLFALTAFGCGITGLVLPFFEGRVWKLASLGWFSGGVLLAILAIFILLEEYIESRRQ